MDLVSFTKSLFCLDWSEEILLFVVRGSSHPETRKVESLDFMFTIPGETAVAHGYLEIPFPIMKVNTF